MTDPDKEEDLYALGRQVAELKPAIHHARDQLLLDRPVDPSLQIAITTTLQTGLVIFDFQIASSNVVDLGKTGEVAFLPTVNFQNNTQPLPEGVGQVNLQLSFANSPTELEFGVSCWDRHHRKLISGRPVAQYYETMAEHWGRSGFFTEEDEQSWPFPETLYQFDTNSKALLNTGLIKAALGGVFKGDFTSLEARSQYALDRQVQINRQAYIDLYYQIQNCLAQLNQ